MNAWNTKSLVCAIFAWIFAASLIVHLHACSMMPRRVADVIIDYLAVMVAAPLFLFPRSLYHAVFPSGHEAPLPLAAFLGTFWAVVVYVAVLKREHWLVKRKERKERNA